MALALGLRLWNNDLTPFLDDEAGLLQPAKMLLEHHLLPATGGIRMSIHINEPPLIVYLTAIPMLVSQSPAWVSAAFAFMDALSVLAIYLTARQLSGRTAASVAALLYAVGPAAIYFGRRTDYFALTPFFTSLAMAAGVYAWQRRSAAGLAVSLTAAAMSAQVHSSSAMTLVVVVVEAAVLMPRLKSRWPLAIAAALIGATLAPYVYLQTHTGWADVFGLLEFLRQPSQVDGVAAQTAATLISGGTYQQLLQPGDQIPPTLLVPLAGWLLLVLVLAGLAIRLRRRGEQWIVLALAALPVLATTKHSTQVLPYYLTPILPAAFVLASQALVAIPGRVARAVVVAIPVLFHMAGYLSFQQTIAAEGPRLTYGMPLRYEIQAANDVSTPIGSRLFVGQVGNQRASFPYLTNYRYQITHFDSRFGLPLGAAPATYVVQAGGHPYELLEEHLAAPAAVVRGSTGEPMFGLFSVPRKAAHEIGTSFSPVQTDAANAVQVRGYQADSLAAGEPSPAAIEWTIADAGAETPPELQQFAHLVDADGATWSTGPDQRPYPRREWHTGDAVLSWFDLAPKPSTPTGGYWLETGFYGYTGGGLLPGSVRLGPVRVQGVSPTEGPLQAIFGRGELALVGVRRDSSAVTLTWKSLRPSGADYTVFVHLLDDTGKLIAQHDSPPQKGAYPTSLWHAGDVVSDEHPLPGGGNSLDIGVYEQPSLARVPAMDPDGRPLGDHFTLAL